MTRIALVGLVLLLAATAHAADEREDTQQRLDSVNADIARLQAELEQERARQGDEQAALKTIDLALQDAARRNRELASTRADHDAEVVRLEAERLAYIDRLADSGDRLEAQVLAAWRAGRESRIKLLLNQDDPSRVQRLLAYYEHLSNAQGEQIHALEAALDDLDAMTAAIEAELAELAQAEAAHRAAEDELRGQREQQALTLAAIEAALDEGETRLQTLQRDRADLETLLERLDDSLADIPSDLGGGLHPTELKGQLPMPVRGRVAAAYGQPRTAGLRWQGWLISAPAGTDVNAIAYGRVAYADWLRGYGLLLIIDHGDGFMSLYGHNEALLAEVGDWVPAGRTIAQSGRNTGQSEGVYFELRHDGSAVDPAAWIDRN
ncbi:peptidoglycan DD-metalloendopeptidase family protein [Marinihelvus fidelis]|uniref:Peptidoglycan DD-metalloendopeptidase family protein n=1 Tax=Marinihelvus fidelis TaxID=2613842 RepID=A0A5N0TAR2_9GAMM|nr:peptidoglycan DD-metalloendopeptidase family protein [Marinihelvus fidelis]KAA9131851.1 peptidoglycan DD-metalloendopeptidase family protein [Marinihelvus fidelis]